MLPVERLKTIPLFSELDAEQLARLAPLFHRVRFKIGDIISQQGDPGDAFYVLDDGILRVRYVDARDEERVLGYLNAPAFFGETSLLTGTNRDVTIDVFSKEANLLVLPKHEFDALLSEHPKLKECLIVRPEVQKRVEQQLYPWLQPGEVVLVNTRRHWYALASRLVLPGLFSILLFIIAVVMHQFLDPTTHDAAAPANVFTTASTILLLLSVGWAIGAAAWLILDWSNDYYIVTNQRVIHLERVAFLFDEREEAPIEMVTNVIEMSEGPAASFFHFTDLRVETSGRQVDVNFTYAPTALHISQHIFEQINRVRDRAAFEKRERMRAGIREELWQRLAPERAPAVTAIPKAKAPSQTTQALMSPSKGPSRRTRHTSLGNRLNAAFGMKVIAGNQVTWRKHWFVLVEKIDEPLAAFGCILTIGLVHLGGVIPIRVLGPLIDSALVQAFLFCVWILALFASGFWLWYQYADWSNDIYRVTNDRVIDIERAPFGLKSRSIETTLDRVQDISYIQSNPLAVLFNYGDLIIETAGAGRFTFHGVKDPRGASQEIVRRRDAHRIVKSREEATQERREFLDWFMEYHRFLTEQGEINPPKPQSAPPPAVPSPDISPAPKG